MYKTTRHFFLSVLILVYFQLSIFSAFGEEKLTAFELSGIQFKNGCLKVSIKNQDFNKAMQVVSKKSGVKIVINESEQKVLSIDFDYTPLENALKMLLKGTNYIFIYHSEESANLVKSSKLSKVLVFPKYRQWSVANQNQDALDNIFTHFSRRGIDLETQVSDVLEKIKEIELIDSPQDGDGMKELIKKATEELFVGKRFEEQKIETSEATSEVGNSSNQANPGIEAIKKAQKLKIEKEGSANRE